MKKIFIILLMLNSVASFANPLKVNALALTGADGRDEDRIHRALSQINEVVNSDEFRNQILSMKYNIGNRLYNGFSQTTSTPEQVLAKILEATENFSGGEKHSIDLFLDMYYERSSTVGYTSPKDKFIHMNRYFHANYTAEETAGNIFHEWLHKIGFDHSKRNNAERPHSVPYKLGKLLAQFTGQSSLVNCSHD
jgi:hypothetical protein